ncbi:hypothetical protein [Cellulomonas sp. Root137]|uniref:hypothetical protein n=1 Tax=Cellulomonas sp. Root137 TaxID=1736459 RepID=UPI0006F832D7|nr:hypothetical protein [Cellulomonas sp. Root137]KQY44495.1 hypothetical protein ASD18_13345 [Cellulomonas sp. Root137]KRD41502.1 hypothetical protein ASE38_18125 [Cellulomonas sp. Root930]
MTTHEPTPVPVDDAADVQPVRDLLAEHVPLALIVDLVTPEATSAEILEAEGLPDDAWWEKDSTASDTGTA